MRAYEVAAEHLRAIRGAHPIADEELLDALLDISASIDGSAPDITGTYDRELRQLIDELRTRLGGTAGSNQDRMPGDRGQDGERESADSDRSKEVGG